MHRVYFCTVPVDEKRIRSVARSIRFDVDTMRWRIEEKYLFSPTDVVEQSECHQNNNNQQGNECARSLRKLHVNVNRDDLILLFGEYCQSATTRLIEQRYLRCRTFRLAAASSCISNTTNSH